MLTTCLLLAVAQQPATPAVPALVRLQMVLPALPAQVPQVALEPIQAQLAQASWQLARVAPALELALTPVGPRLDRTPRAPWAQQDPGDSLYRAGRRALNRNRYADAARLFTQIYERYPRSTYAGDGLYWAAFALYRSGAPADLRRAQELLGTHRDKYPNAATRGDAQDLAARIDGALAQRGDEDARRRTIERADSLAPRGGRAPRGQPPRDSVQRDGRQPSACDDDEDSPRIAALNALLQMDAERAMPILQQILRRRDPCSEVLRRKAIFLVSQKRTAETENILLDAARNDPDMEVRQQAIFWLSQVNTPRAVDMLDSILRTERDPELLDKAVFALSQQRSPRAAEILRNLVERPGVPTEVRGNAIFWLGQSHSDESQAFLRALYARVTDDELKEKILFAASQNRSTENNRWLMEIAMNEREDIEMRKKALFWAGQGAASMADLVALYDRIQNTDMKEQLIFVYSQRREREAVDKLMEIARRDPDRELRKKAIFWLGQSRDPRVAEFLLQLINEP